MLATRMIQKREQYDMKKRERKASRSKNIGKRWEAPSLADQPHRLPSAAFITLRPLLIGETASSLSLLLFDTQRNQADLGQAGWWTDRLHSFAACSEGITRRGQITVD